MGTNSPRTNTMIFKVTYSKCRRSLSVRVNAETPDEAKNLAAASGTVRSWLKDGFRFHALYIAN